MKRFFLVPVLFLFLFAACETDPGVSEVFSQYRYQKGVTSITVPGWVIRMTGRMGNMEKEERALLQSIDKVRILTIEDDDLNARSNFHEEFYQSIQKRSDLEELLVVRSDGEEVTIFGRGEQGSVEEVLILVGGDDNAMIYVKGHIKPELVRNFMNKDPQGGFKFL